MVEVLRRDSTKGELITIDNVDQNIIVGLIYRAWDESANIPADSSFNIAFVPSGNPYAVKIFMSSDCSTNLWAIEDASWNTNGEELSVMNFNRETGSDTCSVKVYGQPGGINWSAGTVISKKQNFVSQSSLPISATNYGSSSDEYSYILSSTKLLLLSFQNIGADPGMIALHFRITDGVI